MSSPNILLTRIDNRLVHGQVGVTWTSTIGANLLVVVDDVVANDDIQQKLMGITAETYGFGIRFFTIEKTINVIGKAAPHQKIFLICRTPQTVRKLVEGPACTMPRAVPCVWAWTCGIITLTCRAARSPWCCRRTCCSAAPFWIISAGAMPTPPRKSASAWQKAGLRG